MSEEVAGWSMVSSLGAVDLRLVWLALAVVLTAVCLPVLEIVSHAWRVAGQNVLLRRYFALLRMNDSPATESSPSSNGHSNRAEESARLGEMTAVANAVRSITPSAPTPSKHRRRLEEILENTR